MNARMLVLLAGLLAFPGAAWPQAKGKPGDEPSAEETLSAVVHVRAKILPNARSIATLGPQREGSGKPLPIGDSNAVEEREPALVASFGADGVNVVHVVSRRPFSGSWEYLLDAAIFTYPPVMNWSGASLINARGNCSAWGRCS